LDELIPGAVTVPEGVPTPTSLSPDEAAAEDALATSTPVAGSVPVSMAPRKPYGEVVAEFDQGGRRVQIFYNAQGTCQLAPAQFVAGSASLLMFDNRSARKTTIVIDGQSLPLPAYQYHIARIRFSRGPGEYRIHCGSQFNAGTVMVQP
jgi:hypothetical protein